jgi:hypothetical protein
MCRHVMAKGPHPCTYFSPTLCQHATPIAALLLDARATTAGDIARRPLTPAGIPQDGSVRKYGNIAIAIVTGVCG